MVRRVLGSGARVSWLRVAAVFALCGVLAAGMVSGRAQTEPPAESAALDLKDGRVDTTPLMTRRARDDRGVPVMPPWTLEGEVVAVDTTAHVLTLRTERFGEVKIGLPPDLIPKRRGEDSTIEAIRPGDRVYATVETASGARAVFLVSQPPMNPLVNYIGIPALLLVALAIWWTGRGHERAREAGPRAAPEK